MKPPPDRITANIVELRRADPADSEVLFRFASDPEVMQFMDWPMPANQQDIESNLRSVSSDWDIGAEYQWVIIERSSGELVGTISCRPKGHAVDFGYFLGQRFWGKGLASDAASTVITWLAIQPEIVRIWATVDAENIKSRRLLERLGLQLEGVLRMATLRPNIGGSPRDTAVYACTKSDALYLFERTAHE